MRDRTALKVWISKYALSQGIFELCAETSSIDDLIVDPSDRLRIYRREGGEWHRTKECAVIKAEQMRVDKIESLKKQIAKLGKLKFD